MNHAKQLKRRLTIAMAALLIAFIAMLAATYAWYVYNTGRHTTNVRMAAGAGANLQISNEYKGPYGSAAVLQDFSGQLEPVSTNQISRGFQKVTEFADGSQGQPALVADIFGDVEKNDYYQTSLFLRTNGSSTDIYVSDIGFEDSDQNNPISSAIRVGLVVHKPGENGDAQGEYIFAISDKKNPQAQYNTSTGQDGYVLDMVKKDGSTTRFTPYTEDNYCIYNSNTGEATRKKNSVKLCTISGTSDGSVGTPVKIDIYIWLEGCDEDCTNNLCSQTLKNLAVSFAGITATQR